MKILQENAGQLTNFEVLDFLKSRGAAKDPTKVLAPIAPSEFKVYDYLVQSVAKSQTRESIAKFVAECKPYKLTKSEIANIINIRPSSVVEIDPLIENLDSRLGESVEDLVQLVVEVFPPSPDEKKAEGTPELDESKAEDTADGSKAGDIPDESNFDDE
ncbi:HRDC-like protein [Artemisia annua]|uniref:DNA-directed RNA polymerase III subunit RPC9 n=1 Tax=Artemisia annua TaxID=35608 RepID=A0A2U1PIQ3_ARTAN|nr:HRDC-like protein [Artemisia annua]